MTSSTSEEPLALRRQSHWLALYLFLALAVCAAIDLTARNRTFERWMTGESSQLSAANGKLFSNNGSFVEYEERILLDEMPATDFSRGRLYFFGTSNMKWAFTTWDLPDRLKGLLANYATGGAAHHTIYRLVRYVGEKGMFATGNRSEVIIGVSYHLGTTETPESYFPALLHRQDIYAISVDDRLIEADLNPVNRWMRIEKARSGGFVRNAGRLANNAALASLHLSSQPPHDPTYYQNTWRAFMGPYWKRNIDREVSYLHKTITLLSSHHVPVKIILLPQGTWMDALPYPAYYDGRVNALTRATRTPLLDWSKALPDADFVDSNHLGSTGQAKFRAMILALERERLTTGRN